MPQIGNLLGVTDKRRKPGDNINRFVGEAFFTANAGGTTSTIVGANAAPGTNTNVVRLGDKFKLFSAGGVLKEETVFKVTGVAVAGSTTITFAVVGGGVAAGATVSGDVCRKVGLDNLDDDDSMDNRLTELGFSASYIGKLNYYDKMFTIMSLDDTGRI